MAHFPPSATLTPSGYGPGHSSSDLKAYDLLVQAEAGLAHLSGPEEGTPTRVGVSVADIGAGMHAYSAVLEAVMARDMRRGGEGKEEEKEGQEEHHGGGAKDEGGVTIEVSLFSSIADWMNVPYLHHASSPPGPSCVGLRHPSVQPCESTHPWLPGNTYEDPNLEICTHSSFLFH